MVPEVSIIIAAFNAQNTIATAIESALNQANCNVEVIVVDDCSTDETALIAKRYGVKDSRVRVLKTHYNMGCSEARNLAIKKARGIWLAVLDADDFFAPHRISTLLEVVKRDEVDIVVDSYFLCGSLSIKPHSTRFAGLCPPNESRLLTAEDFIRQGLGSTKPLFKASLLQKYSLSFDPFVSAGEDLLLYTQLVLLQARCVFVNRPMYFRTEAPTSLSRQDRIRFLTELLHVLDVLEGNLSLLLCDNDNTYHAIAYRRKITHDALAAAQWKQWAQHKASGSFPSLLSGFRLLRHLCFKKQRYAICPLPV